ncbi:MAG: hypothetical protein JWQ43_4198 [Glaciihabitans sp.]|nr:hypothetical protein [Glaciihabitans sp.]
MPEYTSLRPSAATGASLSQLAGAGITLEGSGRTRVTSVTVDSHAVQRDGLFVALPGRHRHGADFTIQALAAGAAAILTDLDGRSRAASSGLPLLLAEEPRAILGGVAARVYGTAAHCPMLFGVTGTNGKTSTVHLIDALLTQLGVPSGRSSTTDRKSGSAIVASRLTSPEAPELHALLARMNEDAVRAAAIEVSAQALARHRVDGLRFEVAGFTNLSHDHRDEFVTEADYLAAKLQLFQPDRANRGVVLLDSPAGRLIRAGAGIPVTTVTSRPDFDAEWRVDVVRSAVTRTYFTLTGPNGEHLASSIPLLGRHMAADCGLAMVMLLQAGFEFDRLKEVTAGGVSVTVAGRADLLSGPRGPRVFMDFSHTPDSIEKTLTAIRQVTDGKIIVILGADGEKDPSKRVPMGRAAALGADVVIITDHHPRFEDPASIRRALIRGATRMRPDKPILEVPEPSKAIRTAIGLARINDSILWVGPGQTDYRIVRGRDIPYSPRRDTRDALAEAGWGDLAS